MNESPHILVAEAGHKIARLVGRYPGAGSCAGSFAFLFTLAVEAS